MLLYRVCNQCQAKAVTGRSLGGKEWVTDSGQVFGGYPISIVGKGQAQPAPSAPAPLVGVRYSGLHSSAFRHGVSGIQQQVGEHLPQGQAIHGEISVVTIARGNRDAVRLKT